MRAYLKIMRAYAFIFACAWCVNASPLAWADPAPDGARFSAAQEEVRVEIEAFLRAHTARVPAEDVSGYLADFVDGHPTIPVLRTHLTRAFADFDFTVALESITVLKVLKQVSTVKVVQRTERVTAAGAKLTERAEIQYFLRRPTPTSPWRIEHTTRKRLDDAPPR